MIKVKLIFGFVLKYFFQLFFLLIVLMLLYVRHLHVTRYKPFPIHLNNVLAYTKLPAYTQGEKINIYIHTTADAEAFLFKLDKTLLPTNIHFDIKTQYQENMYSIFEGLNWQNPYFLLTEGLSSGYYYLKIQQKKDTNSVYYLPLIISPKQNPKIAVIASTNTWQAYNNFGGKSNYENSHLSRILKIIYFYLNYTDPIPNHLPFNRPYNLHNVIEKTENPFSYFSEEEHIRAEWNLAAFLSKNNYEYGVYSDFQLDKNPELLNADVWIFNVHSEYWSHSMITVLEQYIRKGGKVIWASGNNIYREIEYNENGYYVSKQLIDVERIKHLSGAFSSSTESGYGTMNSYKLIEQKHWIFKNTSLKKHDNFGALTWIKKEGKTGASGLETDKIADSKFQILALGNNTFGPAYMVFRDTKNKGWIFNASSISFTSALEKDSSITIMMKNMLNNAIQNNYLSNEK